MGEMTMETKHLSLLKELDCHDNGRSHIRADRISGQIAYPGRSHIRAVRISGQFAYPGSSHIRHKLKSLFSPSPKTSKDILVGCAIAKIIYLIKPESSRLSLANRFGIIMPLKLNTMSKLRFQ